MRPSRSLSHSKKAFTLLEMSIVIMVLLTLMQIGLFSSRKMDEWRLGRSASETLRAVYAAQRMYLADNPTVAPAAITDAMLLPYMASNAGGTLVAMPTVTSLTKNPLAIMVTVSPPVINAGNGVVYDPSGSTRDSLWDVGE
jgi:prepilin-type N-terminal cleavage/methylation domain-containing protein